MTIWRKKAKGWLRSPVFSRKTAWGWSVNNYRKQTRQSGMPSVSNPSLKSPWKTMMQKWSTIPDYLHLPSWWQYLPLFHLPWKITAKLYFHFQQFLMVLIKNLGDQDLAYRFGVNQSTVSRHFKRWIDVMHVRLSPLVKWPNRNELMKTMPMEFRNNFQLCVVIIDCFEVFIERPTNLKARVQMWSNYKYHNTVKFWLGFHHKVP